MQTPIMSHPRPTVLQAINLIKSELKQRLSVLEANNKLLEAQRLEQRTNFDLEMLETTGHCAGSKIILGS